jgi:hypothetical protein
MPRGRGRMSERVQWGQSNRGLDALTRGLRFLLNNGTNISRAVCRIDVEKDLARLRISNPVKLLDDSLPHPALRRSITGSL